MDTDNTTDRRRLTKSEHDRIVAGVAGGLGEYFGVDAVLFRVGFVALTIAGGSGLLLYALGWLFLPEVDDEDETPGERLSRFFHRTPVLAIILTIIVINALSSGWWWHGRHGGGGPFFVIPVFFLVVLMFRHRHRGRHGWDRWSDAAPAPPADTTPTDTAPPSTVPDDAPHDEAADTDPLLSDPLLDPLYEPERSVWPPLPTGGVVAPPRRRVFLTPVTMSLLVIGAGVAALVGVSLQTYLALALCGIGAVLLVGSMFGRARGLILVGLLVTGAATLASVTDLSLAGGTGERHLRPIVASHVRPYRLGAGELTLDLTALKFETTKQIEASVGVGHLLVKVPRDVDVLAHSHVGIGDINAFGRHNEGTSVNQTARYGSEANKRLDLELRADIGQIDVEVE